MLRGIRLIIYDLDGTLIDSTEAIVETFKTILAAEGISLPETGVIESLIGEPMPEILRNILPHERWSEVQRFWDAYIPIYARISPQKTRIFPGVPETLKELKMKGFMQSVATQKRGGVASRVIRELGLLPNFDLVLGIDDVAHPKPAPDIIELTLKRLGVKPGDAVFVDDTTIGLEAGKNAGVHMVGITTGTHDAGRLSTLRPDCIIDNLRELTSLVAR